MGDYGEVAGNGLHFGTLHFEHEPAHEGSGYPWQVEAEEALIAAKIAQVQLHLRLWLLCVWHVPFVPLLATRQGCPVSTVTDHFCVAAGLRGSASGGGRCGSALQSVPRVAPELRAE